MLPEINAFSWSKLLAIENQSILFSLLARGNDTCYRYIQYQVHFPVRIYSYIFYRSTYYYICQFWPWYAISDQGQYVNHSSGCIGRAKKNCIESMQFDWFISLSTTGHVLQVHLIASALASNYIDTYSIDPLIIRYMPILAPICNFWPGPICKPRY